MKKTSIYAGLQVSYLSLAVISIFIISYDK